MAFDDYEDAPEQTPVEIASQITGQALGVPHEGFKSVVGANIAWHMSRQAWAAGFSLPKGQLKYNGLPQMFGLNTLVGRQTRGGFFGGARGALAGGLIGSVMGANPFTTAAIGFGAAVLPKLVGGMTGNTVTRTGIRGMLQAFNVDAPTVFDKIIKGHTFGKASMNQTGEYLKQSTTMPFVGPHMPGTPIRTTITIPGSKFSRNEDLYKMMTRDPAKFREYTNEVLNKITSTTSTPAESKLAYKQLVEDATRHTTANDLYQLMTGKSRSAVLLNKTLGSIGVMTPKAAPTRAGAGAAAAAPAYVPGMPGIPVATVTPPPAPVVAAASPFHTPPMSPGAAFLAEKEAQEAARLAAIPGIRLPARPPPHLAGAVMPGVVYAPPTPAEALAAAHAIPAGVGPMAAPVPAAAITGAGGYGYSYTTLKAEEKASRLAAAGRLGVRAGGVVAAGGLVYMGAKAIVTQVDRGAKNLRDNLRSMNTALRLTEFGGRGSFMNDVVNTERDRAISAMQFLRSGRDFIGLEARLLSEGFNG